MDGDKYFLASGSGKPINLENFSIQTRNAHARPLGLGEFFSSEKYASSAFLRFANTSNVMLPGGLTISILISIF